MSKNKLLKDLNKEQKKAVKYNKGPLLIVAGAGTGKTKTITQKIAYLIDQKMAKPEQVLALTFTDKAAEEMEQRVDILLPYGMIDSYISTFHALGDRLLRDEAILAGLNSEFKVLTKTEQVMFFREHLFEFELDLLSPTTNPRKHIEGILQVISRAKDENVSPQDYLKYANKLLNKANSKPEEKEAKIEKEIALAYQKYKELKKENNFLDFADQVYLTYHLLKDNSKLLKKYRRQFKYILVDEFQDTNHIQYQLVKLLSAEKKNLTVVGDDDQSIYKFRGASISNIMEFKKDFKNCQEVVLTKNYRSSQKILDKAYQLIKHNNPDRLEVKNKINKKLKSQTGEGNSPKLKLFDRIQNEADFIVSKIKESIKNGDSYNDSAILIRANSYAQNFIRALNQAGIPWVFSGQSGLYQENEIKLLTAFLRSIASNNDNLSLFHLAQSDIYNLPINDLIECLDRARKENQSLFWVFKKREDLDNLTSAAKEVIAKLIADIEKYRQLSKETAAGQLLYQFIKDKKIIQDLTKEDSQRAEVKIKNIADFFNRLKEFEAVAQDKSVQHIREYLDAIIEAGDNPESQDFDPELEAVSLLTVHSAKGLEFKNVFLASLTSDRFPARRRGRSLELPNQFIKEELPEGDYHTQEERRLFYVAMTRAKENLYFSASYDCGGKKKKKPSPFIAESLGEKILKETKPKKENKVAQIKLFAQEKEKSKQVPPKNKTKKDALFLNAHSIDDYDTCPLKYKYSNIFKVPVSQNFNVVFGIAIHSALEKFLKAKMDGKKMTLKELQQAFLNSWSNEGFFDKKHQKRSKKDGLKMLKNFYQKEKEQAQPQTVEDKFKIDFSQSHIKGRWDVAYKNSNKLQLVDFKTSTVNDKKKAKSRLSRSVQLDLYAWGHLNKYGKLPDQVGLYFLGSGNKAFKKPTKKTIKKVKEKIKEVEEGVQNDKFEADPNKWNCQYCAFSKTCPYAKVG